jgi:hypothetical protein
LVDKAKERFEKCLEQFKESATWTPIKVSSGGKIVSIGTVISPV